MESRGRSEKSQICDTNSTVDFGAKTLAVLNSLHLSESKAKKKKKKNLTVPGLVFQKLQP